MDGWVIKELSGSGSIYIWITRCCECKDVHTISNNDSCDDFDDFYLLLQSLCM